MINHALSCPKGGLVLARHDYDVNQWLDLGAWDLKPSAIYYKPKTKIRYYRGKGPGLEHVRKGRYPKVLRTLQEINKGANEMDGQGAGHLSW